MSLDSIVGNPVMSLSIAEFAANLTLLSEPLVPLPDELLLLPVSVPVHQQWGSAALGTDCLG